MVREGKIMLLLFFHVVPYLLKSKTLGHFTYFAIAPQDQKDDSWKKLK